MNHPIWLIVVICVLLFVPELAGKAFLRLFGTPAGRAAQKAQRAEQRQAALQVRFPDRNLWKALTSRDLPPKKTEAQP